MPSAKILESKKAMVDKLAERLNNAQAGVLADYRGLTVDQDTELRRKLREANVEYTVIKNSIIHYAIKEAGLDDLDSVLEGPTALATSTEDVVSPAKVLCEFAKTNDKLEVKGGFVEGAVISVEEVKKYASIPSKDVLISKMMGSLLSPIGALARALQAIADKVSESGSEKASDVLAAAPETEEAAQAEAEATPAEAEVAPAEAAPAESEAAPAEAAPAEAEAAPAETEATSAEAEAAPAETEATSAEAEAAPAAEETTEAE